MKTNKLTLLAAMLATALLVGSSALAQVTEDTTSTPDEETTEETTTPTTNQETTEQTTSAPTQGGTENATPTTIQEATEGTTLAPAQTPAPAAPPTYALSADGQSLVINGTVEVPCADVFRDEQAELAALGNYPTVASDEARACEELGVPNPYPAPYLYDTEGFLYTYDPVADRYTAADPASCLLYIYDLVAATFYTYDPATSSYV